MPVLACFFMKQRLMAISLIISIILTGLKFIAFYQTHSKAILTDALESIINIVAAGFAMYSLSLAAQPRDFDHPYGHGKIEFFSAGFEGALIILAGFYILIHTVEHIFVPEPVENLGSGMIILGSTIFVNGWLGWQLQSTGKKENSLTLIADGRHLWLDALSSAVLLIGISIIWLTGFYLLDSLLSLAFAMLILWNGYQLLRKSIAGLMDEADPQALTQVVSLLNQYRKPVRIDVHNLRLQQYGADWHIDCHLTLPYYLTLEQVHDEVDAVKKEMSQGTPGKVEIFIHADPCLPPQNCVICQIKDCPVRQAGFIRRFEWTVENTTTDARHFIQTQ